MACGVSEGPPVATLEADAGSGVVWEAGPPLPRPVANNAVVGIEVEGQGHIYSFLGLDETKRWDGVVDWAFRWVVGSNTWEELPPVPGPGRLAGTAEVWGGKIFLFGGYTVAEDGTEVSVPNVDVFDPATDSWSAATPMPVPVDDAVSGVWKDSLIVLVSGWHETDNVADVQLYNPRSNTWSVATPIPGPPVFGHAGKVVGDRIIYLGGANTLGSQPRYQIERSAWVGEFDARVADSVSWHELATPPAPSRYRAASAVVRGWALFAGGTDNPYNYNGTGYDGVPAHPTDGVFAFDPTTSRWVAGPRLPEPRMDLRALGVAGGFVVLVGGMDIQQTVRAEVWVARVEALAAELSLAAH